MAGGNIRAGGAFVEIFGKDYLDKSLKAAGANFQAFGKTVAAVGAGITAAGTAALTPLIAMTKSFVDSGDEAQKASLRTGATTNAITELGYAAEQSGSNLADVEIGLRNMQRQIVEAGRGSEAAIEALSTLGLTVKDLQGLSPDKQFELLADRISAIEDPSLRAATAMELFGRSGTKLLPLLNEGSAGIRTLRQEAELLGRSIDQEDADAAAALGDAWDRVKASFTGAAIQVGAALAPALRSMADVITSLVVNTKNWLQQNRDTVVQVAAVAAGAIAAGAAITTLGAAITGVGIAVSGAVGFVTTMAFAVTLLLNPVAGLTIAIGALGISLVGTGLKGAMAFDAIGDAYGAFSDAIKSGDIEAAFEALMLGVELAWLRTLDRMRQYWEEFKETSTPGGIIDVEFRKRLREQGRLGKDDGTSAETRDAEDRLAKAIEQASVNAAKAAEKQDKRREELETALAALEESLASDGDDGDIDKLTRDANAIINSTTTARERLDLELAKLDLLADKGLLTLEQYLRAERKLFEDFYRETAAPADAEFGGGGGLLASTIARAAEFGLNAARGLVQRSTETTGTFSSQAAALLSGGTTIDKQQLDALHTLSRDTRDVRKAIERAGAVFI